MSHFQLHYGGQARRVKGALAREHIRRELHGLALQVQGTRTIAEVAACAPTDPVNVADWWKSIRTKRAAVYGSLFRFIDIAVRLRTPRSVLLVIPDVIRVYIEDATEEYESTPPNRPPVMRRVA